MRYHNITKDDMLNGDGLRVVLWVSGCERRCKNCHNPVTWDIESGLEFDDAAKDELFIEADKPYISGLTVSGGDPLHPRNRSDVGNLLREFREHFPHKTIWLYTGYEWHEVKDLPFMSMVDVLVDGTYIDALKDVNLPWRGSSNQKIIDVKKSIENGKTVLVMK